MLRRSEMVIVMYPRNSGGGGGGWRGRWLERRN